MGQPPFTGHVAKIGNFLREIYVLQDMPSLQKTIIDGLADLIPGDNIFLGDHDMEDTRITGCAVRHLFETPDFLTIVNSCLGEHPLWEAIRTGGQTTRCISDHASARKWENTTLYQEALGKEGVRDHLSVEFGERTRRLMSVGIFRSSRGFSTRDHETLRFLIPHLGQAQDNARLVGEAAILSGEAGLIGVIHLDADARPREMTEAVRETLIPYFRDAAGSGDMLPETVAGWISKSRKLLDRGALEHRASPLRVRNASHLLELRLFRQRLEPGYLVTVRLNPLSAPAAIHLTPRETEVLHWLREGKRNDEIGIILGMGVTTVKTHLKHIYQKLGVENRTAAARAVTG